MKLITISGLDGSGKSTQIRLLKEYLELQGQRVFYFHAGSFSIANKILGAKKDSSGKEVSVSRAGWLGIFLRKVALRIDLLLFKLLRNKLRNNGYDYILSDRYFYDTVINIDYLSKAQNAQYPHHLGAASKIQKPHLAIYLRTNPDNIMSRERKPDQGIEYLQKKKELYDSYADSFGMKIIDGSRNKEEIFEKIKILLTLR